MPKTKIAGAAGRFGVRYGQLVRRKIAAVESKQRKRQRCIFCNGRAIRLSKGIWECNKCGKKFAEHAYYLEQDIKVLIEEKLAKQIKENEKKTKTIKKQKTTVKKE